MSGRVHQRGSGNGDPIQSGKALQIVSKNGSDLRVRNLPFCQRFLIRAGFTAPAYEGQWVRRYYD